MAIYKKSQLRDVEFRRAVLLALLVLSAVLVVIILMTNEVADIDNSSSSHVELDTKFRPNLPKKTDLAISLEQRNQLPPRNRDLFPSLAKDHIKIVLYVHNRPQYLQIVVRSLLNVEGIGETLLIVSHDGYFVEMDKIVKSIKFCQVKQIFAPYSPHLYPDRFPGVSPGDCQGKDNPDKKKCRGNADRYGNHRSPKIVSLKHHWWWMMNAVWDGLAETKGHSGHILFIEEDHFIYPNAYRNIQLLAKLKPLKCPDCYAVNLAPSNVKSNGEGWESLIVEKIGNVGYAFNRTVWRKIHSKVKVFCTFDDYNWDITMWATVYPSLGRRIVSLRGPRTSAVHFGMCGLHQGNYNGTTCIGDGQLHFEIDEMDKRPNIVSNWPVYVLEKQTGYRPGFKGWGGWGDHRDQELCLSFAYMYHVAGAPSH